MTQDGVTAVAPPLEDGRYTLVSCLGEGGMATVYRAWDERLQAWRAVKVLKPEAAKVASVRSRFLDEARAMARLQHPNILTVHDVGTDAHRPFMVMELVSGGCLNDILDARGPLPPAEAMPLMAAVLDALHFAHSHDVGHRDIKPHNIMMTAQGIPQVADFGIARIGGALESDRTRTGAMMGTLAYMAPEQRTSARRVDGRADVYAAGNTLYALVTDEEPFDLYAASPDDPSLAGLPDGLRAVVLKATRHKPDDRFESAAEMAAALRALVPGTVTPGPAVRVNVPDSTTLFLSEQPVPASVHPTHGSKVWWGLFGGLLALAILLTGFMLLLVIGSTLDEPNAPSPEASVETPPGESPEVESTPPSPLPTAPVEVPASEPTPKRPQEQPAPAPVPKPSPSPTQPAPRTTRPPPAPPAPSPEPSPAPTGPSPRNAVRAVYRRHYKQSQLCMFGSRNDVRVTVTLSAAGAPTQVVAQTPKPVVKRCLETLFKNATYRAPSQPGRGTVTVTPPALPL